jgi:hypothetical protein
MSCDHRKACVLRGRLRWQYTERGGGQKLASRKVLSSLLTYTARLEPIVISDCIANGCKSRRRSRADHFSKPSHSRYQEHVELA